jgi:hypothetical protein
MLTETVYAGRSNTFSLRLTRGGVPENLMAVNKYELIIEGLRTIDNQSLFIEKDDGIVEMDVADDMTADDVGSYRAHLVTYDPVNHTGVRWPTFKLKIKG